METKVLENIVVEGAPWRLNEFVQALKEGDSLLETHLNAPNTLKGAALSAWREAHWGASEPDTNLHIELSGLDHGAVALSFQMAQPSNGTIIENLEARFKGLAFVSYE